MVLTRGILIKLGVFVLVSVVGMFYLATRYLGAADMAGASGYRVHVDLPHGGGMFPNSQVTYRGVAVGSVVDMELNGDGMRAIISIDGDAPPIPSDVDVRVANRSAIGEQYVDLRPRTADGPYLAGGDVIAPEEPVIPMNVSELLLNSRDFAASVPEDSLRTVVDESYEASRGAGEYVERLLSTSQDFVEIADEHFGQTASLIQNGTTVLETQQQSAEAIRAFSRDLNLFAETLSNSDGDLRSLIAATPAAAREIDALFGQVGPPLGLLMANLVTPAQVFGVNAAGVEDALTRAPEAISVGYAVVGSGGLNIGLAQTFFDPTPCTTGYGGTTVREGLDTSPGGSFNTQAGCDAPPSSGTNVRGPRSVESNLPDAIATPQGAPSSSARSAPSTALPGVQVGEIRVPDQLGDLMGGVR